MGCGQLQPLPLELRRKRGANLSWLMLRVNGSSRPRRNGMVGAARHGAIGHAATVGGAVAVVFVVIGVDEEKTEWQKSSRGSKAVQPDPLRLSAGGSRRRVQAGMRVREGRRCLQRMPAEEVLQTRAGTSPSKMRWSVNSSANVRGDMSSMREKRSDARAGCSDKPTRSRNQEAQPVGLVVSERPASRHDPTRRSTATCSLTHFSGAGHNGRAAQALARGRRRRRRRRRRAAGGARCRCRWWLWWWAGPTDWRAAAPRARRAAWTSHSTSGQSSSNSHRPCGCRGRGPWNLAHSDTTQVSVDGIPLWRMVGPFGMRSSRDISLPCSNFLGAVFTIVFAPSWTAWPSRGSSSVSSRTRLVSGSCCTRRRSQQRPGGFVTRGRNGTGPAARAPANLVPPTGGNH